MSTLIKQIEKDVDIARRHKETEKLALLSTLKAEIEMVGKNSGNRETTDEEALAVIRKFVKNANDTITAMKKTNKLGIEDFEREIEILSLYLPKQLSPNELINIVQDMVNELPEKNPKMMGKIMGQLKSKYDGLYDGKIASQIVKDVLNK